MVNRVTQIAGSELYVARLVLPSDENDIVYTANSDLTYNAANVGSLIPSLSPLQFVEIEELQELGEYGTEYNLVTYSALKDRDTDKFKGQYNNGSYTTSVGRDDDDPGQIILNEGAGSDVKFLFHLKYPILEHGDYFEALVTSFSNSGGGLEAIAMKSLTIELTTDSDPFEVSFKPTSTVTLSGTQNALYGSIQLTDAANLGPFVLLGYEFDGLQFAQTQSDDSPATSRLRGSIAIGTTQIGSNADNNLNGTRSNVVPDIQWRRPSSAGDPAIINNRIVRIDPVRLNGQNLFLNIDTSSGVGNAAKLTPTGTIKLLYVPIGG